MSGITSSVGLISGINSQQIIDQLLAIEARPAAIFQRRIAELQTRQAAFLDLNTRLSGLRTAAQAFATGGLFRAATATSSNADALGATAALGAPGGSYRVTVDRLAGSRQLLSAGFTDTTTGLGLTQITLASTQGGGRPTALLSGLNGGAGVQRGGVLVTDRSGASATVDLSRAATLDEVLEAFNTAAGVRVRARAQGDGLVIEDLSGGAGTLTIADAGGTTTATSLGIAGSAAGTTLTGARINVLSDRTALSQLNDGLGVDISTTGGTTNPDFSITARNGTTFQIDIGDVFETVTPAGGGEPTLQRTRPAVTDLGGVVARINEATGGAVTARIDALTNRLVLQDNTAGAGTLAVAERQGGTTAADLGLLAAPEQGRRLIAGLGDVLTRSLNGGRGLADGSVELALRDGSVVAFDLDGGESLRDLIDELNTVGSGRFSAALSADGARVQITDLTAGAGTLTISGDGAAALGISGTFAGGVSQGRGINRQFVGTSTLLSSLNGGRGVGSGSLEITNAQGARATVSLGAGLRTVGELLAQINGQTSGLRARVNDAGDGITIEEELEAGGTPGGSAITVRDASGAVARNLNLALAAPGAGAQNAVSSSASRSVTLLATDGLSQVVEKINAAGGGVSAAIINEGAGARPFRLSLTALQAGLGGDFFVTSQGGPDLGLISVASASDARVFIGADDPARAVLVTAAGNSVAGAIPGVTLDLRSPTAGPATVTVAQDAAGIESQLNAFIEAFNTLVERIDTQSDFDTETEVRGPLLGDSSTQQLRSALFATVTGVGIGITGRFTRLSEIGVRVASGRLSLDADRLRDALATDPGAVADLVAGRGSAPGTTRREIAPGVFVSETVAGAVTRRGVLERVADLADSFIRPVDGVFTNASATLDSQVAAENSRIDALELRLESRREILTRQFATLESTLANLQQQQTAVANIRPITIPSRR